MDTNKFPVRVARNNQRAYANGVAHLMRKYTPEERIFAFWSKVAITANPDKCWEWQACCNIYGYGTLNYNRQTWRAHRIAWILSNGEIPIGLHVLHTCDNRKCCNPKHLFLGTNRDNVEDKERKGRGNQPKGEKQSKAKLTSAQVAEIRQRYVKRKTSQYKLAIEYGVSQSAISAIVLYKHWKG